MKGIFNGNNHLKYRVLFILPILTGCIGDKVTFSEVAEVVQRENTICFGLQRASDYKLKSMSIFKRNHEDDRESITTNDSLVNVGHLICLPQSLNNRLTDGEYVVRFSLKPIKKHQNVRVFSNAIQIDGHQVKDIPLHENEITHYLGNNF